MNRFTKWLNRFTKWLNRFKHLKDKTGSNKKAMKIDTYHMNFDSIKTSQNEGIRFRIVWIDSWQVKNILWYDSQIFDTIQSESIQNTMNRCTQSQKLFVIRFRHIWIDSYRRNTYFDRWDAMECNFLETQASLGASTNSKTPYQTINMLD